MDYDATAKTALAAEVVKPKWFAFLDIVGDPVRATTSGVDVTFPGDTPDPDLAGQTFLAWNDDLVNVSEIRYADGGSGAVTASISGLVIDDNALLNILANPINWQGRGARFWQTIHNQADVQQGAVVRYHGGFMSSLEISGSPESQTISVIVEGWLASFARGSGRTYMDQKRFDPADLSAEAALSSANGGRGTGLSDTGGADWNDVAAAQNWWRNQF